MKKLSLLLLSALLAFGCLPSAPAHLVQKDSSVRLMDPPPLGIDRSATGSGYILVAPSDTVSFQFDATESDGSASGTARFTSASGYGFTMYVDCFLVVNHKAFISGIVTEATYPILAGQPASFEITDGPDQISRPITGISQPCTDQSEHALYTVVGSIQIL